MKTDEERAQYVIYWQQRFKRTGACEKARPVCALGCCQCRISANDGFVDETANILDLVKDVLRPRSFDEFVKYGFDDPPPH